MATLSNIMSRLPCAAPTSDSKKNDRAATLRCNRCDESVDMRWCVPLLLALVTTACGGAADSDTNAVAPAPETASTLPANGDFVGRIWISTTQGRPLGSMIVFLPDRTLLMDSCFETYRVSEWGVAGERIRWREDSIPIEADVSLPSKDELTLQVVGQDTAQTYIAASAPYVCPDMPK